MDNQYAVFLDSDWELQNYCCPLIDDVGLLSTEWHETTGITLRSFMFATIHAPKSMIYLHKSHTVYMYDYNITVTALML